MSPTPPVPTPSPPLPDPPVPNPQVPDPPVPRRAARTSGRRHVLVAAVAVVFALVLTGSVVLVARSRSTDSVAATSVEVSPAATTGAPGSTTPGSSAGASSPAQATASGETGVFARPLGGRSAQISSRFFGMTAHRTLDPQISYGAVRLWDTGTTWRDLEPSQDAWNFGPLDSRVAAASKHHAQVLLTLGITPTWASSRPTEKTPFYGAGATSPPRDLGDWRDYVRTVATRYRGRIAQYEIWNEPDSPIFWHGTTAQLTELTIIAAKEIRRADPAAKVLMGGPNLAKHAQTEKLLDEFLAGGGGSAVDAVCLHLYPGKGSTVIAQTTGMDLARSVLAKRKKSQLPLWMCESGYARAPGGGAYGGQQALALVARSHLESAYLGLARQYWYAFDNRGFVGVYLVKKDLKTPTDAARAYDRTYRWMVGARFLGCAVDRSHAGTQVWACRLQRDGATAWAVWRVGDATTVTVPAGMTRTQTLLGRNGKTAPGRSLDVPLTPILLASADWR